MPRLPAVNIVPQACLRARFWPGVGYSIGDLGPIAFQFFRDELGKSCDRPLAHFGFRHTDNHSLIRPNHHPRIYFRLAGCRGGLAESTRQLEPKRKSSADRSAANDERTAIHSRNLVHGILPFTR